MGDTSPAGRQGSSEQIIERASHLSHAPLTHTPLPRPHRPLCHEHGQRQTPALFTHAQAVRLGGKTPTEERELQAPPLNPGTERLEALSNALRFY